MSIKNLLDNTSIATFGDIDRNALLRKTVVAVVFDPSSGKFLCQYWENYMGLTCLLSGGIEDGEDSYGALLREIAEETGYTDFQIVGKLGGTIKTYYVKNTGESLVKEIVPYLVSLTSLSHGPMSKEEDEKFENLLESPDNILVMMARYEQASGSTLADHKAILARAVAYLEK